MAIICGLCGIAWLFFYARIAAAPLECGMWNIGRDCQGSPQCQGSRCERERSDLLDAASLLATIWWMILVAFVVGICYCVAVNKGYYQ